MTLKTARVIYSLIFMALLFGGAALNVYTMRSPLESDLKSLTLPHSPAAARESIAAVEKSVNSNIAAKTKFIDLYASLHVLLAKNEMADFDQVRSKDGGLFYGNPFPVDTGQAQKYAGRVARLARAAEAKGARVLFLNPPDMVIKGYSRFERGMPFQDLNVLQDAFLSHLRAYGVAALDTRYSLLDNGLAPEKMIFKTDHHWTIEACFEVFRDLVAELNRRFAADLDPEGFYRDPANYDFRTYPNFFLGSLGRSTGVNFSGLEDLTLMSPSFDSDYTVEMVDFLRRFISRRGPAEKSLLYAAALQGSDPYMMMPYNYYLSGISPWVRIVNHQNPAGPTMLMVHDSYSLPLACFLAPLFSEIHMIWPLDNNPVQVEPYLAENTFDYVLVELIPANTNESGVYFFVEADEEKPEDENNDIQVH